MDDDGNDVSGAWIRAHDERCLFIDLEQVKMSLIGRLWHRFYQAHED